MKEEINWRTGLPDADTTVLVRCPDEDDSVWLGYYNGEGWVSIEGASLLVTHWAHVPAGPDVDTSDYMRALGFEFTPSHDVGGKAVPGHWDSEDTDDRVWEGEEEKYLKARKAQ